MNACEELVSRQSFTGFDGYNDAKSILNVEPRLERGFQHPEFQMNISAISDGSYWFLCVVTGDTEADLGVIVGSVTGTLIAQIREHGDHTMISKGRQTLAPIRAICHDNGGITFVFAYFAAHRDFRVAATSVVPNGVKNACQRNG